MGNRTTKVYVYMIIHSICPVSARYGPAKNDMKPIIAKNEGSTSRYNLIGANQIELSPLNCIDIIHNNRPIDICSSVIFSPLLLLAITAYLYCISS
jgi:hypothetical protein